MKVEFIRDLPIKAMPMDNHYQLADGEYDVYEINMGHSSTSVVLKDIPGCFNSVHFAFYLNRKQIDIYRSGLFSNYGMLHFPMICYMEE